MTLEKVESSYMTATDFNISLNGLELDLVGIEYLEFTKKTTKVKFSYLLYNQSTIPAVEFEPSLLVKLNNQIIINNFAETKSVCLLLIDNVATVHITLEIKE